MPIHSHMKHRTPFYHSESMKVYEQSYQNLYQLLPQLIIRRHTSPEQMAYAESKKSCLSALSRSKFLGGSTESRFAAVGSTVAHFTTLGARKFMNRATRICINFCSSSNYVATRARGKWLTLGAKYRVFWAVSSAKFWVGPRKPDFQPYEAPQPILPLWGHESS